MHGLYINMEKEEIKLVIEALEFFRADMVGYENINGDTPEKIEKLIAKLEEN